MSYGFIGMFEWRVEVIDSIWAVQTLDLNKSEHTELFRLSNLIFVLTLFKVLRQVSNKVNMINYQWQWG